MSCLSQTYIAPEEYLAIERGAGFKSEYFKGEMFAMAGASPNHVLVVTNVASELRMQLKKTPCRVYSTDLRLKVSMTGLYVYPDVMVVAQPLQLQAERTDTVINPLLIAEVLSQGTRSYDKDEKFAAYRSIPDFQEYLTIDQYAVCVEHYTRTGEQQWTFREYKNFSDRLILSSIPVELLLSDVYENVQF